MSLGDLFGAARAAVLDLQRIVASNQAGRPPDADLVAKADAVAEAMSTPVPVPLRAPAGVDDVARAESTLGRPLPDDVRRIYTSVADGGFGPGSGLLSLDAVVEEYRGLTGQPVGPGDQPWPADLLPLVDMEPGYDCIDLDDGRIISFDPELIGDGESDRDWLQAFVDAAPSLRAYLEDWLERPTPEERAQAVMEGSMVEQARAARAAIAAMTPEERAAMGLPEVGWERVVWGGIGLDED